MSKLFNQVLNVCKELDSAQNNPRNVEFLAGSIINEAFFPALMIQKDDQRLAAADPNREAWVKAGIDREEAIKIELKKSEDFLSDWTHYGKDVEQYLLREYSEDLAFVYPKILDKALADRLVQMRRFLKKYPHPSTISFLPECEELLAAC